MDLMVTHTPAGALPAQIPRPAEEESKGIAATFLLSACLLSSANTAAVAQLTDKKQSSRYSPIHRQCPHTGFPQVVLHHLAYTAGAPAGLSCAAVSTAGLAALENRLRANCKLRLLQTRMTQAGQLRANIPQVTSSPGASNQPRESICPSIVAHGTAKSDIPTLLSFPIPHSQDKYSLYLERRSSSCPGGQRRLCKDTARPIGDTTLPISCCSKLTPAFWKHLCKPALSPFGFEIRHS